MKDELEGREPLQPESSDGTPQDEAGPEGTKPAPHGTETGPSSGREREMTSILDHTVVDRTECLHPT